MARQPLIFFLAVAAGAASIYALGVVVHAGFWTEAAPVFLMALYGFGSYAAGAYENRLDRLGDNVYYLGFLFTLVSLVISLTNFSANEALTSILVRSFGVALTTTIAGLIGRIVCYLANSEPNEDPAGALQRLGDSADVLARQLTVSVDEIRRSHGRLATSLEETFTHSAGVAATCIESSGRRMQEATSAVAAEIQSGAAKLQSGLNTTGEAAQAVASAVSGLVDRIQAIEAPADLVTQKLAPLTRGMASQIRAIEKSATLAAAGNDRLTIAIEGLENVAMRLDTPIRNIESISEKFGALAAVLEQICKRSEEIGARLKAATDGVIADSRASADTLQELAKRASADSELAARHRVGLEEELQRSRAGLGQLRDQFNAVGDLIRERAANDAKVAASYQENMKEELAAVRELNGKLRENAVSIINFISEKLSGDQLRQ